MQPIRIRAIMQDGRIGGYDPSFPLDSILAHEWIYRNYPDLAYTPIIDFNNLIEAELPFEKRGNGKDWYWACSFNQAPRLGEYILYWHKRFDDQLEEYIDFQGKRGKVNIKSARYKNYRMPLPVQLFDYLEWFAVGDLEQVKDLCSGITHIGKKTSQGLGAIDYWEVEPWREDWSVWRNGKLTRAIPFEEFIKISNEGGRVELRGIRPPYWLRANHVITVVPEMRNEKCLML